MAALRSLLLVLAVTAVAAQSSLPALPLFPSLPGTCGRVTQVQNGDTCDSMAAYGGITLDTFKALNPLVLCDSIGVQPGSAVCTGDNIAFCNDVYVAAPGDTCATISDAVGTVINVDGTNATTCTSLSSGVPVCVSPDPSVCAVDSLCGVAIPAAIQGALSMLTDYCSIVAECQNNIAMVSNQGKDALALTINSATPAVSAAAGKDGHPELVELVSALADGPVSLSVTITPGWYSDGSGLVATDFSVPSSARRFARRKLLGIATRGGQAAVPRGNYGYGR